MQPDFIVIDAMKCGTSTVCAYLNIPLAAKIRRAHVNPSTGKKVLDRLRAKIASDARALLAYCGKPEDYWNL